MIQYVTNRLNDCASFVAKDGREHSFWVGSLKGVDVGVAQCVGVYFQAHLASLWWSFEGGGSWGREMKHLFFSLQRLSTSTSVAAAHGTCRSGQIVRWHHRMRCVRG